MKVTILATVIIFLLVNKINGQAPRPITPEDYAGWRMINGPVISNNGHWISYEQNPNRGNGSLFLRSSFSNETDTFPRGYNASLAPSSDFLVFRIHFPYDSIRAAKVKKTKSEDIPADSLGIYLIGPKRLHKFPLVRSYQLPEEKGSWVSFMKAASPKDKSNGEKKSAGQSKDQTGTLVFFRVSNGDTLEFRNVTSWHYAKKGNSTLFIRQLKDSACQESSLWLFNPTKGTASQLFTGKGQITKPVLDEQGEKYAFLYTDDTTGIRQYELYLGLYPSLQPEPVVKRGTTGMPENWLPSENSNPWFSQDGSKLYLGTAPLKKEEPKDSLPDDEKAVLDIWHWKETLLQPQQKVQLEREKNRSYLAVWHLNARKFVQLADPNIRDIEIIGKGNGDIALGYDLTPYQASESWEGRGLRDYYAVDLLTGIKGLMVTAKSYGRISPGGKYFAWYNPDDSSYYCRTTDTSNQSAISLTKKIPVAFYDEKDDHPSEPPPYGIAGWAPSDRFIYIYDRYDIWRIDPAGSRVPVAVTQTFGRRNELQFRYLRLDKEEEFIPAETEVLLRAFSERNLSSGYFSADFNVVREPSLLILDKFSFGIPQKARDAKLLIWTKENVSTYPDLWFSDTKFTHQQKMSDANPQQARFVWPRAELVEWTSFTGEKLRGILYVPENLNPAKKYPMIVYYYERLSNNLYKYHLPAPSRSTVNATTYASNGYVVFMPDITYRTGFPGQSAYDAVMSGVAHLTEKYPYIDKERMGLQGQSWGGYQTAWMITRTNLFAAAMAGAPVSNMTSAYGGIRWETGISRMFQYEKDQSRIGGSLWEKPWHYIENSPLFSAPRIQTPLLMMHNDNDGAVPWSQGIELYIALRRLGKPVWMLTYNNEPHNLKAESWGNRMDLDKRMFQFFNHYLKGEEAPEWMEKGIRAIDKGKITGY